MIDGYFKNSKGRYIASCICVCTHLHMVDFTNGFISMGITPRPILVENWCPSCECETFKSIHDKIKPKIVTLRKSKKGENK